ncbi:small heat shock protein, chloroplastic-like [Cornus florida]|uniref:small heat shock protein, chloroplastic-like n=1 Tax=Cornus florida TaxID=4283 RepID=UPI00289B1205|nr:small heat shock protein, chloroplastic-like [Cornus florida]
MSQTLANFSIYVPISSSQRTSPNSKLLHSKSPNLLIPISTSRGRHNNIKAVAGDDRDSLDHLQRASKNQPQGPQQPKKRVAQVTPIGLWDRFPTARTVQQMMETMERMMEDPLAYGGGWPSPVPPTESGGYSRGRTPWEIKEGKGEYKMRFDMPGMTKEDVKVWVEEKMLVVKAEKVPKERSESGDEGEEEWSAKSYGRYSSRIALPENVQFEKIKAEVKDGVLYIAIPKASATSKILDINVE